jgi:hypothetical protein
MYVTLLCTPLWWQCSGARTQQRRRERRTMNMLFQPDLTLCTWLSTMRETWRMMSSRISFAPLWRMTTTKGLRKSFWNDMFASSGRSRNFSAICTAPVVT